MSGPHQSLHTDHAKALKQWLSGLPALPEIVAELAVGAGVRVRAGIFTDQVICIQRMEALKSRHIYAVRVYTTEDSPRGSWRKAWEFKAGRDFDIHFLPGAWSEIHELASSRKFLDYDSVEEFISDMSMIFLRAQNEHSDLYEHYTADLPILYREDIDLDDDAIYTDTQD